jgi:hypothetical protein
MPALVTGLANGLRILREKQALCDVVLVSQGANGKQRLLAHQAVLGAVSPPLLSMIQQTCSGDGAVCENGGAPQPLELQMDGVTDSALLTAVLDQAYAKDSVEAAGKNEAFNRLGKALQLSGLGGNSEDRKKAITKGLQRLRSRHLLCDMVVAGAGARIPVHQVVMAAACPTFRAGAIGCMETFIAMSNDPTQHSSASSAEQAVQEPFSQSVVLELEAVESASALHGVINHIYDGAQTLLNYNPNSFTVNRDVLRLALALELPLLRDGAEGWLVDTVTSESADEYLALCDQLPVNDLRERIRQRLPVKPTAPLANKLVEEVSSAKPSAEVVGTAPAKAAETATSTATPSALNPPRQRAKSSKVAKEAKEQATEQPSEPPVQAPGDADEQHQTEQNDDASCNEDLYKTLQTIRYASGQVPEPPSPSVGSHSGKDAKVIATLQRIFMSRPVWMETPLLKNLPPNLEYDTLMRLLPYVAYKWKDGPWENAYTALGWDPRVYAEDAKWLQVIKFRDPFFKKNSEDNDVEPDCTFRRPPSLREQLYQFCDIKDDFIENMINDAEVEKECSRKTGWLNDLVFHVVRERMTVKSQLQREARAKKEEAKGSRGKGSLPPAKRARSAAGGGG